MNTDELYILECLVLGEEALRTGNPPVGSLVVWNGQVIGRGVEEARKSRDITDHAEIIAVRDAIAHGYEDKLREATLYTTHEPCIMCTYVIRHHKVARVVYGVNVPEVGGYSSNCPLLTSDELVPKWGKGPEVVSGILSEKCEELNLKFKAALLQA